MLTMAFEDKKTLLFNHRTSTIRFGKSSNESIESFFFLSSPALHLKGMMRGRVCLQMQEQIVCQMNDDARI